MAEHPAEFLQPRKKPTQARSRHTWETILEAAAQVLVQHGYQGSSTNRIAERAGVSVGTLYEYFPNKEILLSELQSHWNDVCWEHQKSFSRDNTERSLREAIHLMFEQWISILNINPALYAALVQELPTRANKWKADLRLVDTVQLVSEGLERYSDELSVTDLPLTCELLIRGIHAYLDHLVVVDPDRLKDSQLVDELTEQFCEFCHNCRCCP